MLVTRSKSINIGVQLQQLMQIFQDVNADEEQMKNEFKAGREEMGIAQEETKME